ncbi:cyclic nucleotide-binding protein [Chthoniobacter flavus Ellin428]|uniref:Glutaminase n=1 Tax=Chthoniobacter flavus Ellin428 TaxID=497964 RepID=B4DB71_9BACT|nr:glutaminase A [Chthoniobacter flavus]EDY16349.1 cyclic nucleotide-binding protein [Chthoniobacter flavus Ellin428]TCO90237.1 L-glutaminase [Chthoniobacter flavus]
MTAEKTSLTSSPIRDQLEDLHRQFSSITDGAVASHIVELARANPNAFGICIVTTNGGVYEIGDSRQEFTVQAISKPFVYGLALEDEGRAEVLKKVGVEPTGDSFSSISLDPQTGSPRNPMINAGAIASTGLVHGRTPEVRFNRILETISRYAGRELKMDQDVYSAESATGHRNRAIGFMLRNFNIIQEDPMPVVETYFQQCSILAHCRDLATMAATLANCGVNPLTGERAIQSEYVESVLGVMGTCGMYDYAGEWLYDVGMPAKSGVAGGVIAVLPGQLGIGVFSPPLDQKGNSVRGVSVCSELSRRWDLHLFNRPGIGKSVVRLRLNAGEFNSSRVRTLAETKILREHGQRIQVFQLQDNLVFSTAEYVVRALTECAGMECLILDFRYVISINDSAGHLFHDILCQLHAAGCVVLFTGLTNNSPLRRLIRERLGDRSDDLFRTFDELDAALQWSEDRLLARTMPDIPNTSIAVTRYELLNGLNREDVAVVQKFFERRNYAAGEIIIQAGEPARELFLLTRGVVTVFLPLEEGRRKRLATFSPGMAFGEMAMIDHAPRSATIVADTDVSCDLLTIGKLAALGATYPKIKIHILENISLELCRKLRKANREIAQLV